MKLSAIILLASLSIMSFASADERISRNAVCNVFSHVESHAIYDPQGLKVKLVEDRDIILPGSKIKFSGTGELSTQAGKIELNFIEKAKGGATLLLTVVGNNVLDSDVKYSAITETARYDEFLGTEGKTATAYFRVACKVLKP